MKFPPLQRLAIDLSNWQLTEQEALMVIISMPLIANHFQLGRWGLSLYSSTISLPLNGLIHGIANMDTVKKLDEGFLQGGRRF